MAKRYTPEEIERVKQMLATSETWRAFVESSVLPALERIKDVTVPLPERISVADRAVEFEARVIAATFIEEEFIRSISSLVDKPETEQESWE